MYCIFTSRDGLSIICLYIFIYLYLYLSSLNALNDFRYLFIYYGIARLSRSLDKLSMAQVQAAASTSTAPRVPRVPRVPRGEMPKLKLREEFDMNI